MVGFQNGKILGYYIGYKETQSPAQFIYETHEVQTSTDQSSTTTEHTISKLKKFTQYTVHVKAYNVKGISPASANLNVFTLEDGESVALLPVFFFVWSRDCCFEKLVIVTMVCFFYLFILCLSVAINISPYSTP